MDALTVLITGAGAPGIKGTLYSLHNNFDDRQIKTVGTDIRDEVIGKYLCDQFYRIKRPNDPQYLLDLLHICEKENVDVVLPQNTAELAVLAKNKSKFEKAGTKVAVSSEKSIEFANDKYKLMELAKKIGVPTAEYNLAKDFDELLDYSKKIGWPGKPIVIKPPQSNGMRGVRIIDESVDLKKMLYTEKPTNIFTKMEHLKTVLGDTFPPLMIMEYLPHEEYTVDILGSSSPVIIPRKRDLIKSGITFEGTVEKNEQIIEYSEILSRELKLQYAFGFQFKMDENKVPKLLESNPRVQGTMILSTFAGANIIYGAIKEALNEKIPEFNVKWGTRLIR
ncbi:MAG: ATP-grasp domain-containing protein, partial [Methanosarcina sp.]|nr:ATP-grasp domain-containing protein [Methanosarcina sp.]